VGLRTGYQFDFKKGDFYDKSDPTKELKYYWGENFKPDWSGAFINIVVGLNLNSLK
jgi:hypothetical protein